jgi:cell division protein FtsQ
MTSLSSPLLADKRFPRSEAPDPSAVRKRNRVVLKSLLAATITIDVVLALLLAYLFFLHMPYFNLQHVEVTGNRRLSRAEVVETSETEAGINLLTVNLSGIAGRLQRHPWIRSASVYRRFPGSLVIEIEERTPRAILAAEKLYYVDGRADYFTRLLPGDSIRFPLFTGVTPEDLRSNGPEIQEMIRLGLHLLDLIERGGAAIDPWSIGEIRLNLDDGLSLHTRSGRTILLGKDDFERKIQRYGRLKRLLTRRGEWQNARIINLDFEDRALVHSDKAGLQG